LLPSGLKEEARGVAGFWQAIALRNTDTTSAITSLNPASGGKAADVI